MADLSLNKNRNKFNIKIAAIFKENADIVLLKDTRLGNKLATLKNEFDLTDLQNISGNISYRVTFHIR